jgi:hypothetical protein
MKQIIPSERARRRQLKRRFAPADDPLLPGTERGIHQLSASVDDLGRD